MDPLSDTDPRAEAVQIALLRQASVTRRVGLARSLSTTTIELSRRAIARTHPGASETERRLVFVELHYGGDLARRVRAYMEARGT